MKNYSRSLNLAFIGAGFAISAILSTGASATTWRTFSDDSGSKRMYDADSLYIDRITGFVIFREVLLFGSDDPSKAQLDTLMAIDCDGKKKRQIGIYWHNPEVFQKIPDWATRPDGGRFVYPILPSGGDKIAEGHRKLAAEVCGIKSRLPTKDIP